MRHVRLSMLGVPFLGWIVCVADVAAREEKKDAADKPPTPEQLAFFEKNIRPVLVRECYACHSASAEKVRGDFKLDTREGLRKGGENGVAIVPGDPKASPLLKALHRDDPFVQPMPPPPKKKLSDDVIADIEKWIAMGAPDPRDTPAKSGKTVIDVERGRKFWAFQAPASVKAPAVKDAAWPRGDIDRFLLAQMEAKGLKPVADADARTLVRRLYFDLIGLPPTPAEVEEFVAAHAVNPQAAVAAAADKLLASPRFGERWGRHWLDVARYAESSGRAANFAFPHAWRYRDYVIAAFNADKRYDQFVREQLAGDLLPANDDKEKAEFAVATGFLAIGPKALDERSPRQFQMDVADEQIDVTFQAFQGLTAACARCHDHKFDPIPQKDYYALSGIFRSTETCYGTIRLLQSNHPSPLVNLPKEAGVTMPLEPLTSERRESINKQIADLREQSAKITGDNAFIRRIFLFNRISTLQSQLSLYESDGTPRPLAMGVREGRLPADSRVYERGELSQPGETVPRGFPQVLTTKQPAITQGSGRRELADWIASKDNPLTARVMANRVWLHLIGHGLVPTPDNFGASGLPPTHPALLDHLALTFVDNDWSVKKLIRTIVLSRAYQMSSQFDQKNYDADPDNVLVWHMRKRRLEAEALRDAMLALSGQLDPTPPRGSSVAQGGEGNVGFRFRAGDAIATDTHRTVYLPVVRDGVPEMLTVFDFPDPSLIIGERPATTIPAQSLYLMNSAFVIRQADAMVDRLGTGDDATRVRQAFLLCYGRPPVERELKNAEKFFAEYSTKKTPRAAWAALCQALFASAEFAHH
jgi:cytochrome c553